MRHHILRRIAAFNNAFEGMKHFLLTQRNAWIHLGFTGAVILAGFLARLDRSDWAIVIIAIAFVWIAEIINTSIEALVDLTTQQIHPLAKIAKDTAAAAVLFSAIIAVILGTIVFLPPLLRVFGLQD
ncbi:MAG: diacylglycerol kinase family protein [Bellilinea sp.]|jgi:diacylglycerol kinase